MKKIIPNKKTPRYALISIFALALCSSAHATLLVYEGFNGYADGSINGQAVTNTTGLTGNYNVFAGGTTVSSSGGLTFSNLQVSGGALTTTTSTDANGTGVALSSSSTSTVYGSYLVNLSAAPSNDSGAGGGDSFGYLALNSTSDGSASNRFYASAFDSAVGDQTTASVKYIGNPSNADSSSGVTLDSGTYLVITEIMQSDSGGTITNWILTASQFDSIIASEDSITLAGLNGSSAVTAKAVQGSTTSSKTFSGSLQILMGFATDDYTIDEIRYGTTLADVTPIPELGSYGLILGTVSALVLLGMRRRR